MYSNPDTSTDWTERVKQLPIILLYSSLLLSAGCNQDADLDRSKKHGSQSAKRVETVKVTRRELAYTLERTGSLKARRRVQLYNQEEGRLVELHHYEGDAV